MKNRYDYICEEDNKLKIAVALIHQVNCCFIIGDIPILTGI